MKEAPAHVIVYPDGTWLPAEEYEKALDEKQVKVNGQAVGWVKQHGKSITLTGAACCVGEDFAQNLERTHRFWNPVDLEEQQELLRQRNLPQGDHYPEAW